MQDEDPPGNGLEEESTDPEDEINESEPETPVTSHKRKLRILMRERGFQRCRKCRSINPLDAQECLNCGEGLEEQEDGENEEIQE